MTDTDRAINYKLRNTTAISNINGAGAAARVSPLLRPAGAGETTSIVYTQITEFSESNLAQESQLCVNRYQIVCYAKTRADAKALADVVKTALHNISGTIDSQVIKHLECVSSTRQEDYDDGALLYTVAREYDVFFN